MLNATKVKPPYSGTTLAHMSRCGVMEPYLIQSLSASADSTAARKCIRIGVCVAPMHV